MDVGYIQSKFNGKDRVLIKHITELISVDYFQNEWLYIKTKMN
jgi:hypothetical protein